MPTLITADDFRDRFDISSDILDGRITPNIGSASRRLRQWVGETNYTNALGADAQYADMRDDLKNAEAHLAFHFAISGFNSPLATKGVVQMSRTSEGREIRQYLPPEDTQKLASIFLELAREIAEPYAVSDGTPTATFDIVPAEEECLPGVTRTWDGNRNNCR